MLKQTILYGLIGGVLIAILMVLGMFLMTNSISYETAEVLGYVSMLIGFSTVYFGIKKRRDDQLNGVITFKKAFLTGLGITAIVTVIYIITWVSYVVIDGGEFMDEFINNALDSIRNSGKPQNEIDQELASAEANMELFKSPWFQIIMAFIEIAPVGLLVSIVSAAILQKK